MFLCIYLFFFYLEVTCYPSETCKCGWEAYGSLHKHLVKTFESMISWVLAGFFKKAHTKAKIRVHPPLSKRNKQKVF